MDRRQFISTVGAASAAAAASTALSEDSAHAEPPPVRPNRHRTRSTTASWTR